MHLGRLGRSRALTVAVRNGGGDPARVALLVGERHLHHVLACHGLWMLVMVRDDEAVSKSAAISRLDGNLRASLLLYSWAQGIFRKVRCSLRSWLDWLLERLAHHGSGRLSHLLVLVLRLVLQKCPKWVLLLDHLACMHALYHHGRLKRRRSCRVLMVRRIFA